jgi:tRNA modification GTPase
VEAIGVRRAMERAEAADLRLLIDSDADWSGFDDVLALGDSIRVRSKSDLGTCDNKNADFQISATTGEGLGTLRTDIVERIRAAGPSESIAITRDRQVHALRAAQDAIGRALKLPASDVELRDHEVRAADAALDRLVGRIGVEEMLGAVFSRFCIGK